MTRDNVQHKATRTITVSPDAQIVYKCNRSRNEIICCYNDDGKTHTDTAPDDSDVAGNTLTHVHVIMTPFVGGQTER